MPPGTTTPGVVGAKTPLLEVVVRAHLGPLNLKLDLQTHAPAVAVVGASGAGKTTLLRTVAGVEERARGRVRFRGEPWLDSAAGVRMPPWERRVGWVPQESLLMAHLSVRQNLAYGGSGADGVEEVAELLAVQDLLDRRPARLSGGERQRVALGRALLSSPRLLLLDEPFAALDRPLRELIVERVVERVRARRIPVLLVSHDEADVAAVADERWELHEGHLERG